MPTYEYICLKCDHHFDFSQSIKDQPLTTCPKDQCKLSRWGKGKMKRAVGGGAGLIFKGSGFYITDYRSESYKEAAKKDAASASPSGDAKSEKGGKSEQAAKPTEAKAVKTPTKSDGKPAKSE